MKQEREQEREQEQKQQEKKRKLDDAFGMGPHDVERYGQPIANDFFIIHVGHGIYDKKN
jgi:hypothetical protein